MECGLWPFGFLIFLCLLIIIYGTFLTLISKNPENDDVLNREIFQLNGKSYSLWPITHFVLYFVLGYYCPCYWKEFTLIGVGWEAFESINGKDKSKHHVVSTNSGKQYTEWWSGSISDIIANSLGLASGILTGNYFRQEQETNKCTKC